MMKPLRNLPIAKVIVILADGTKLEVDPHQQNDLFMICNPVEWGYTGVAVLGDINLANQYCKTVENDSAVKRSRETDVKYHPDQEPTPFTVKTVPGIHLLTLLYRCEGKELNE